MKTRVETVLVAGADGALGQDAVRFFAARGLKVIGTARNDEGRRTLESRLPPGVKAYTADLADEQAVKALIDRASREVAPPDALLNAAGGFRWAPTSDTSTADFDFLVNANLRSSFLLAKHLIPGMRERRFGRMVFVSSRSTLGQGTAGLGLYAATKGAVNQLVLALAQELAEANICVNAVLPSIIDTPANRRDMPNADFTKWVSTEQLLEVVSLLFMSGGDAVTGALIPVAGRSLD